MKLVGYETGKLHTTNIVKALLSPSSGELHTIDSFLKHGLPQADLIVISGILRGTGLIYKECVKQGRDFLYIDHAYFLKGYELPTWMRITKNRHTFGPNLVGHIADRFEQNFASKYQLKPWRGNADGPIVVLPPTHAICWLFDVHDWLENTVAEIRRYTNHPIKIRSKPQDPIVDDKGYLIRMEKNDSIDTPLIQDISNARAVVAYNSNSVIECVQLGVPVICGENCAAYPVSFKISDLITCEAFEHEPDRQQLFHDLAYGQFTLAEMKTGLPIQLLDR